MEPKKVRGWSFIMDRRGGGGYRYWKKYTSDFTTLPRLYGRDFATIPRFVLRFCDPLPNILSPGPL